MDQIVVTAVLSAFLAVLGFIGSKYIDRYERFEEHTRDKFDTLDKRIDALERDAATKADLSGVKCELKVEIDRVKERGKHSHRAQN